VRLSESVMVLTVGVILDQWQSTYGMYTFERHAVGKISHANRPYASWFAQVMLRR
jgi:hypothetical protein